MKRLTRLLLILGLLVAPTLSFLSGAYRSDGSESSDRPVLPPAPYDQIKASGEWRVSRFVPGGAWQTVLGPAQSGARIRFGLLPRASAKKAVSGRVRVAGQEIATFTFPGTGEWMDFTKTIPEGLSGEIVVEFESRLGFRLACCEATKPLPSAAPNVLIILIDTLRQDHLGCYGYHRPTSPHIDAFAAEAVRFHALVPQSSWTRPSVVSLLTSCYPSVHGGIDRNSMVRAGLPTAAEAFRSGGYETHAFMSNPLCLPYWGIGVEFGRVVDLVKADAEDMDDAEITDAVLSTLPILAGRPWFLYVHFMGPHWPYMPPKPYRDRFRTPETLGEETADVTQHLIDLYDGEIAYTDAQVGRLLDELKKTQLYDNCLIVIMSDHGEQFREHGEWGHGVSLFEEELRVPFLVRFPQGRYAGREIHDLVENVDIVPTLLDAAGVRGDPRFQGRSLLAIICGEPCAPRLAYASLALEGRSVHMARTLHTKFIEDRNADTKNWFDLRRDPRELDPVTRPDPAMNELQEHASRIATLASYGLNILVTGGSNPIRSVAGIIRGGDLAAAAPDFLDPVLSIEHMDGAYGFHLDLASRLQHAVGLDKWYAQGEQSSAHLRLPLNPDTPVALDLFVDGEPLSQIFLADPEGPPAAAAGIIVPSDLLADPLAFDAAVLPRRVAAYVWYVPEPGHVGDEDLDPFLREALTSLGYLH